MRGMTTHRDPNYAGHRFPPEIISHAVWLYFRFPLSLRMIEEMLAARGITVTHETIRQFQQPGLSGNRCLPAHMAPLAAILTTYILDHPCEKASEQCRRSPSSP
jgi:hypothetical protein